MGPQWLKSVRSIDKGSGVAYLRFWAMAEVRAQKEGMFFCELRSYSKKDMIAPLEIFLPRPLP